MLIPQEFKNKKVLITCLIVAAVVFSILNRIQPLEERFSAYTNDFKIESIIFLIGVAVVTFLVEIPALGWKKSSVYKLMHADASGRVDLFWGVVYTLNLGFWILIIFSFGSVMLVKNYVHQFLGFDLLSGISNSLVQLLFYMLVYDFFLYWFHRICHETQFLWELHKYHHSTTDFLLFSGNRVHPLEKVFMYLFTIIPLAVMGSPPEVFMAVLIIRSFIDRMQHSMVNWTYGWIGRWVVFSPIGHRIHHSMEREHWDKNYGDMFVIWDRLFGTYYNGNNINTEVGVTNNIYNQGLVWDVFQSISLSYASLLNSVKTNIWKADHLVEADNSLEKNPENSKRMDSYGRFSSEMQRDGLEQPGRVKAE